MDMSFTTPPATVARVLELHGRILVITAWWLCLVIAGLLTAKFFGPIWGAGVGYYAAFLMMNEWCSPSSVGWP